MIEYIEINIITCFFFFFQQLKNMGCHWVGGMDGVSGMWEFIDLSVLFLKCDYEN